MQLSTRACHQSGAPVCSVVSIQQRTLAGDVVEYSGVLRIGPGPYDQIGIHRVMRAGKAPGRAVFLVHDSWWGFDPSFAGSAAGDIIPPDSNMAVVFAQRGLDVWGIDQRWALVPANAQKLSFMHAWNLATEVSDLRLALRIAASIRTFTGGRSHETLALLGWGHGATDAYALVNYESQLPAAQQYADALIPVDFMIQYAPEDHAFRQNACNRYAAEKAAYDRGESAIDHRPQIRIGALAMAEPNAPSSTYSGLTNLEAAWFLTGQTYRAGENWAPDYHLLGSPFDVNGPPLGPQFTSPDYILNLSQKVTPFQALASMVDEDAILCSGPPNPSDNHLADVRVPVFYVGAEGGIGGQGIYSTTLLGSHDVSSLIALELRPDQRAFDLGHADLFFSQLGPMGVWQPIADWLESHSPAS